ncbi:DUF1415 domain-containing protein [Lacimicrobium sp. SS2-24]|uniref:DUF1415 domain-containing protein n=1 Tax=Lacimicrobium sp. SS2-24 TaxID=2005569 RepID=UPI000B4B6CDA|nr:DUF1415 domain-containing protein [Lacimicrobium sp. SS2-24]
MDQHADYIEPVKRWVEEVVVGFNFCPFAKAELDRTRYTVSYGQKAKQVLKDFETEIDYLQSTPEIANTLLILARGFADFHRYLDLVAQADACLDKQGLRGQFQLASFHPHYQFDGEPANDPSNYTNRAPLPVLHLLRESEVEKAISHYRQPENIPRRNIAKARALGSEHLQEKLDHCLRR